MPTRGDGLSPHKNLRRSTRDHSRLYSSLKENEIGLAADYDDLIERRSRRNGYTRSGRKIHQNPFYGTDVYGFSSEDDELPRARKLTYRQEMIAALDLSSRAHAEASERRNSDKTPPNRRNRVQLDEDDMEDDASEVKETKRSRRKRSVTVDYNEDDKEGSSSPPRRTKRTRKARLMSDESDEGIKGTSKVVDEEEQVENVEPSGSKDEDDLKKEEETGEEAAKDEENQNELEEDEEEEEKEEEDEEDTEDDEDEQEQKRTYSLRTRRPAVVTFSEEQNREVTERRRNLRDRRSLEKSSRMHHNANRNRSHRRVRSDTDSSADEGRRFNRKDRHRMDRSRFMPINMTEKELSNTNHILQERIRKTGGGMGSSDIDPMNIDKDVSFDQVGGLSHHIQCLKEMILFPMLYPEVFAKFNINPPKGVVFYGPPGTGKTLVARALANECTRSEKKVAFFMRKGADCLSKWAGESERQLRLLFDQAYSMRPSIIFFDEIDGLAPVRSSKQDQIHASIVSTLLALMDGLDSRGEVIVIGATNRLDTLDPALRRPGRFDRELRFSLPDVNARRQILDIHTSKWDENKPSPETVEAIANSTSGYCGADLKFLCTEAVLIALRARYPHIYMCSERLRLEISSITVDEVHFKQAMRRITPASRRDLTIPSRPLEDRTSILLGDIVNNLIAMRIPAGYRCVRSDEQQMCELEKIVRALEPSPTVPAVRLLICGSPDLADGGQSSYVLPAILSRLDHLPVFSLSVSSLLVDNRPEEAFAQTVQSAMRASSTGPCILLIPSIDEWQEVVPVSLKHMLINCLESMTGFTPILFLASLNSSFEDSSEFVQELFRHANCAVMPPARPILREKYFEFIVKAIYDEPKVFDASKYVKPEAEADSSCQRATRKLSEAEARELEKMYLSCLRQLRIFLRDRLNRLIRDRRFVDFVMPVDVEDAEDYYEIITNPMCLTDMMEKLDSKKYNHADQFLDDIRLITANALEYNPANTQDGRTIRHMAIGLRDVAEELIDSELDENFVENLENTSRLLQEAAIVPEDEQLIEMPKGFVRKSPWTIKNSLKLEIEKWRKDRESKKDDGECGKRKGRCSRRSSQKPEEEEEDLKKNEDDLTHSGSEESTNHNDGKDDVEMKEELIVDRERVGELINLCVKKSDGWSVAELERMASVMTNQIEHYRNVWDRTELVEKLAETVEGWKARHEEVGEELEPIVKNGLMNGINGHV